MSQGDLTDGMLFIIGAVGFAILFTAFQIFRFYMLHSLKISMRTKYGCSCGGMFKMDEGLSEQKADNLIGQIDEGSLPPRSFKYTCDSCGASKFRFKGKNQTEVVWQETSRETE